MTSGRGQVGTGCGPVRDGDGGGRSSIPPLRPGAGDAGHADESGLPGSSRRFRPVAPLGIFMQKMSPPSPSSNPVLGNSSLGAGEVA